MNRYPRETVEFLPVSVTLNGAVTTVGVTFSVVRDGTRPTVWLAPETLSGKIGVMINGQAVGNWRVFAKVSANPETPVIDCGIFTVT